VTLHHLLVHARAQLVRLSPHQLAEFAAAGEAVILDTRTPTDRELYGCIPGSIHTPRTVLEWRVAMDAPLRLSEVTHLDQLLVVVCNEGFSSSLAAASLQNLGFRRATDLIGGVMGWRNAGLQTELPRNTESGIRCDSAFAPLSNSGNFAIPLS
jgi:rhodanese-related sulfurtransferase